MDFDPRSLVCAIFLGEISLESYYLVQIYLSLVLQSFMFLLEKNFTTNVLIS